MSIKKRQIIPFRCRRRWKGWRVPSFRGDRANWFLVPVVVVLLAAMVPSLLRDVVQPVQTIGIATPTSPQPGSTVSVGWSGRDVVSGAVTRVRDGDTVEVRGVPIRLATLDCAERGTAAGQRATARMRVLAQSGAFACTLHGGKSYDRQVGDCSVEGRDVGRIMIAEGYCRRWRWR